MPMQIRRTLTANNPPTGLAEGQLSVEMASTPPKLWVGVPVAISSNQRVQLNDFATQAWVTSQITALSVVPAGGTQYQALIKGAGTAFGWADSGDRGNDNTAIGKEAFNPVTPPTGSANTGVGAYSLWAISSGNNNTGFGYNSLGTVTTGSGNVGIGENAFGNLTSGNNNTALGYGAASSGNAVTNEIVIGANALGNGSNTVTLGTNAITQLWCGGIDLLAEIAAIKTHVGL